MTSAKLRLFPRGAETIATEGIGVLPGLVMADTGIKIAAGAAASSVGHAANIAKGLNFAGSVSGEKGAGGFADDSKLQDHFQRHGGDFGASNAAEYEQQATEFLTGDKPSGVLEKVRPNGDVVRFNRATDEFGVISRDGNIRTYYKPDPAVHGYPTNLDYFNAQ